MRLPALALTLSGILAGALCGCGAAHRSPAELRLEREDLVAVSRALARVQTLSLIHI